MMKMNQPQIYMDLIKEFNKRIIEKNFNKEIRKIIETYNFCS